MNDATHNTTVCPAIAAIDAPYTVRRPTIPESTSSARPVSSSVRSARTAASTPNTAAKIVRVPPLRQAV